MRINPQFNQMPQRPLAFWEKFQIVELFAQYPALTLKVLLHRRVGMRRADPMHLIIMLAILLSFAFSRVNVPLGVFAVVMAAAGYWQHYNRWQELRGSKAAPWHTFSDGVSPLEDLITRIVQHEPKAEAAPAPARLVALSASAPLPGAAPQEITPAPPVTTSPPTTESILGNDSALKSHFADLVNGLKNWFRPEWLAGDARIYRRLEPLIVCFAGAVIVIFGTAFYGIGSAIAGAANHPGFQAFSQQTQNASVLYDLRPLGLWIMFAAFCLQVDENLKWRHQVRAYLDWYDGQIDGATTRGWSGKKGRKAPATSRRKAFGLSTGVGDDIRAGVERQAEALQHPAPDAIPIEQEAQALVTSARQLYDRRPSIKFPTLSKQTWQIAGISALVVVVIVAGIIGLKRPNTASQKPAEIAGPVAPASVQPTAIPTIPSPSPMQATPSSTPNAQPDDPDAVRQQLQAIYNQIATQIGQGKPADYVQFTTPDYTEIQQDGSILTRAQLEQAGKSNPAQGLRPGEQLKISATVAIANFAMATGKADVMVNYAITGGTVNAQNQPVNPPTDTTLTYKHHWIKTPQGWLMQKGRVLP